MVRPGRRVVQVGVLAVALGIGAAGGSDTPAAPSASIDREFDDSKRRFCRAADRIEDFQQTSTAEAVTYAFETLREVYDPDWRGFTRWRIVFDTANLRAYFETMRTPEIRWVDLDAFYPSCRAPVMMLGMDEIEEAGDVTGAFTLYDSNRNRAFREAFYQWWRIPYDPHEMTRLLEHVESYPCTHVHRRTPGRRARPIGR